ncbi:hypothetical protein BCF59_0053 [Mycoplasmopsis mustelae]|uniref:Uncharacterized protein n=1 Tax=Mycoplasmopsis mustelae TaxID=171289 RepID=A0A4R7UCF9_9BACT|nr:hypothetical protein [Mycoplasmopsis mustelae]TDV24108.1 hypothetical protein BCF59_0053 [Mycoplasmopsis mustelae]
MKSKNKIGFIILTSAAVATAITAGVAVAVLSANEKVDPKNQKKYNDDRNAYLKLFEQIKNPALAATLDKKFQTLSPRFSKENSAALDALTKQAQDAVSSESSITLNDIISKLTTELNKIEIADKNPSESAALIAKFKQVIASLENNKDKLTELFPFITDTIQAARLVDKIAFNNENKGVKGRYELSKELKDALDDSTVQNLIVDLLNQLDKQKQNYANDIITISKNLQTNRFSSTSYFNNKVYELSIELNIFNTDDKKQDPSVTDVVQLDQLMTKQQLLVKIANIIETIKDQNTITKLIDKLKTTLSLPAYQELFNEANAIRVQEALENEKSSVKLANVIEQLEDTTAKDGFNNELKAISMRSLYTTSVEKATFLDFLLKNITDKVASNLDSQPALQLQIDTIKLKLDSQIDEQQIADIAKQLSDLETTIEAKLSAQSNEKLSEMKFNAQKDAFLEILSTHQNLMWLKDKLMTINTADELNNLMPEINRLLDLTYVEWHTKEVFDKLQALKQKVFVASRATILTNSKKLFDGDYLSKTSTAIQYSITDANTFDELFDAYMQGRLLMAQAFNKLNKEIEKLDELNPNNPKLTEFKTQSKDLQTSNTARIYDINVLKMDVVAELLRENARKVEIDAINQSTLSDAYKKAFSDLINKPENDSMAKLELIKMLVAVQQKNLADRKNILDTINAIQDQTQKQAFITQLEAIKPVFAEENAAEALKAVWNDVVDKVTQLANAKTEDEAKAVRYPVVSLFGKYLGLLTKIKEDAELKKINDAELTFIKNLQDAVNATKAESDTKVAWLDSLIKDKDANMITDSETINTKLLDFESNVPANLTATENVLNMFMTQIQNELTTLESNASKYANKLNELKAEFETAKTQTDNVMKLQKLLEVNKKLFTEKVVTIYRAMVPSLLETMGVKQVVESFTAEFNKDKDTWDITKAKAFIFGSGKIIDQTMGTINSDITLYAKYLNKLDDTFIDKVDETNSNATKTKFLMQLREEFKLGHNVDLSNAQTIYENAQNSLKPLSDELFDLRKRSTILLAGFINYLPDELSINKDDQTNEKIKETDLTNMINAAKGNEAEYLKVKILMNRILEKNKFAILDEMMKLPLSDNHRHTNLQFMQENSFKNLSLGELFSLSQFISVINESHQLINQLKDQNKKTELLNELKMADTPKSVFMVKEKAQAQLTSQNQTASTSNPQN